MYKVTLIVPFSGGRVTTLEEYRVKDQSTLRFILKNDVGLTKGQVTHFMTGLSVMGQNEITETKKEDNQPHIIVEHFQSWPGLFGIMPAVFEGYPRPIGGYACM